MLSGDLYIDDDPENTRAQRRALRLATEYQAAYLQNPDDAQPLLAELIGGLGAGVCIRPPLFVDYGSHISVGERTFVNYHLTALDVAPIRIGKDCQIGPNVQLLTLPIPSSHSHGVTSWKPLSRSPSATMSGSAAA